MHRVWALQWLLTNLTEEKVVTLPRDGPGALCSARSKSPFGCIGQKAPYVACRLTSISCMTSTDGIVRHTQNLDTTFLTQSQFLTVSEECHSARTNRPNQTYRPVDMLDYNRLHKLRNDCRCVMFMSLFRPKLASVPLSKSHGFLVFLTGRR